MRDSFEFDTKVFEDPNNNEGVYAVFYLTTREDPAQSAAAGRPIFVEKEYVKILSAGSANNIIDTPVRDEHRYRFQREYEKFKRGDTEQLTGTPLTEVPWITRGQVDELLYRKIRTLEQLAEMQDQYCNVPGMYELKRKAAAWLVKSKEAAPFTAMQAELDALRAELDALKKLPPVDAKPAAAPAKQ
jgi:hypothetical protein